MIGYKKQLTPDEIIVKSYHYDHKRNQSIKERNRAMREAGSTGRKLLREMIDMENFGEGMKSSGMKSSIDSSGLKKSLKRPNEDIEKDLEGDGSSSENPYHDRMAASLDGDEE